MDYSLLYFKKKAQKKYYLNLPVIIYWKGSIGFHFFFSIGMLVYVYVLFFKKIYIVMQVTRCFNLYKILAIYLLM